jgi:hypothetical protein
MQSLHAQLAVQAADLETAYHELKVMADELGETNRAHDDAAREVQALRQKLEAEHARFASAQRSFKAREDELKAVVKSQEERYINCTEASSTRYASKCEELAAVQQELTSLRAECDAAMRATSTARADAHESRLTLEQLRDEAAAARAATEVHDTEAALLMKEKDAVIAEWDALARGKTVTEFEASLTQMRDALDDAVSRAASVDAIPTVPSQLTISASHNSGNAAHVHVSIADAIIQTEVYAPVIESLENELAAMQSRVSMLSRFCNELNLATLIDTQNESKLRYFVATGRDCTLSEQFAEATRFQIEIAANQSLYFGVESVPGTGSKMYLSTSTKSGLYLGVGTGWTLDSHRLVATDITSLSSCYNRAVSIDASRPNHMHCLAATRDGAPLMLIRADHHSVCIAVYDDDDSLAMHEDCITDQVHVGIIADWHTRGDHKSSVINGVRAVTCVDFRHEHLLDVGAPLNKEIGLEWLKGLCAAAASLEAAKSAERSMRDRLGRLEREVIRLRGEVNAYNSMNLPSFPVSMLETRPVEVADRLARENNSLSMQLRKADLQFVEGMQAYDKHVKRNMNAIFRYVFTGEGDASNFDLDILFDNESGQDRASQQTITIMEQRLGALQTSQVIDPHVTSVGLTNTTDELPLVKAVLSRAIEVFRRAAAGGICSHIRRANPWFRRDPTVSWIRDPR